MDNFALASRKSKQSRDEGGHQRVGPEQQADDPSSGTEMAYYVLMCR